MRGIPGPGNYQYKQNYDKLNGKFAIDKKDTVSNTPVPGPG